MPASVAIWSMGSGVAACAISISLGTRVRMFVSLWGMATHYSRTSGRKGRCRPPVALCRQKLPDTIHRVHQLLIRIRNAEPQITVPVRAKRRAAQTRHARLLQQRIRQFLRFPPGALNIRERVKRSARDGAAESR